MAGKSPETLTTAFGLVKIMIVSNSSLKLTFDKLVVEEGAEYYGSMSLVNYGDGWEPDQDVAVLKNRLRGLIIKPYHPTDAGEDHMDYGVKYSTTTTRNPDRDERDSAQRRVHTVLLDDGQLWARKNTKLFTNVNANNKQAEIDRLEQILGVFGLEKWIDGNKLDIKHFAIAEKVMARIEEIELSGKEPFVAKSDKELGILPPTIEAPSRASSVASREKKKRSKKPIIDPRLFVKIQAKESADQWVNDVAAKDEEGVPPVYDTGHYWKKSAKSS